MHIVGQPLISGLIFSTEFILHTFKWFTLHRGLNNEGTGAGWSWGQCNSVTHTDISATSKWMQMIWRYWTVAVIWSTLCCSCCKIYSSIWNFNDKAVSYDECSSYQPAADQLGNQRNRPLFLSTSLASVILQNTCHPSRCRNKCKDSWPEQM